MSQSKRDGKLFYFGNEAREGIQRGARVVYDAVSVTYVPK